MRIGKKINCAKHVNHNLVCEYCGFGKRKKKNKMKHMIFKLKQFSGIKLNEREHLRVMVGKKVHKHV